MTEEEATSAAYRWCVSGSDLDSNSLASKTENLAYYSESDELFKEGIRRLLGDRSELGYAELDAVNYSQLRRDLKGEFG